MARWFFGWAFVASVVACGGRAESTHATAETPVAAQGGSGGAATSEPQFFAGAGGASGGATICPRHNLAIAPCPLALPAPNQCCAVVDQVCIYPDVTPGYRDYVRCIDSPDLGPTWMSSGLNDNEGCLLLEHSLPLGAGDAPSCGKRETMACNSCTCSPSDAACAARCPQLTTDPVTPQDELDRQLEGLAADCGHVPNEATIEVVFGNGCGSTLMAQVHGDIAVEMPFLTCMQQKLDQLHFECADGLSCGRFTHSTLR